MDWSAIASILAERSELPTVVLDTHGRIRLLNRAMELVLGWRRFVVDGKPWAAVCAPPDREDETQRWVSQALRGAVRSYEVIAVTSSGDPLVFHFEFSLFGRGTSQGLLMTAVATQCPDPDVGALEDKELDYEIWGGEANFGEVRRLVADGAAVELSQGSPRCFALLYGRRSPCAGCPAHSETSAPWPRISVRHHGEGETPKGLFELRIADHVGDRLFRIRRRLLPEPTLDAIHRAKVDAMAEHAALSPREREVLDYLLLGRSVTEIARLTGIAVRTVKFHQANLLDKLGADSRVDLVRLIF